MPSTHARRTWSVVGALPIGAVLWAIVGKLLGVYWDGMQAFYSVPFGGEEVLTTLEIAGSILFWWIMCAVVMNRMRRSPGEHPE